MFDYLVIGKGMMGSAALRYLSQASANVAVVGPAEPANWATHDGVFASHYDEGRLSYVVGRDRLWSVLTAMAMAQFPTIEAESGVRCHYPSGALGVAPIPADGRARLPEDLAEVARELAIPLRLYPDSAAIAAAFPELAFPPGHLGMYEGPPGGWLNPRALVRAQVAAAVRRGATVVPEIAVSLDRTRGGMVVTTREGSRLEARRVLVASGAFANCFDVLPRKLAIRVKGELTVLARLADAEAAALADLPVIRYAIASPWIDGIYMTPPTRYPDGRIYLKMGCDTVADVLLPDLAAMRGWVIEGTGDVGAEAMAEAIRSMFPRRRFEAFETRRCIVCYSPHRHPYIDQLDDRLFVATVGNGGGAKPSDAIGSLAARLMLGQPWPDQFDRATFRAIYADEPAARFPARGHISPNVRITE